MTAGNTPPVPTDAEALLLAIDDLIRKGNGAPDDANERKLKWLYDVLTILDNKTAHLLRLDSILLAATTFLIKIVFDLRMDLGYGYRVAFLSSLGAPLLGILFSLSIFRVEWPFLPWRLALPPKSGSRSLGQEFDNLAIAVRDRTRKHNRVWIMTVVAVFVFLVVLIAAVAATR